MDDKRDGIDNAFGELHAVVGEPHTAKLALAVFADFLERVRRMPEGETKDAIKEQLALSWGAGR